MSRLITVRVGNEDYAAMLTLKQDMKWRDILKRGLNMKSEYPTRKEVQAMIDETIERAKRGY